MVHKPQVSLPETLTGATKADVEGMREVAWVYTTNRSPIHVAGGTVPPVRSFDEFVEMVDRTICVGGLLKLRALDGTYYVNAAHIISITKPGGGPS